MRTIIELPDAQVKALARLCRKEGISRAEAIRRAVDKLVAHDQTAERQANLQSGFGLWCDRKQDGREYVEIIRQEWE